MNKLSKVAIVIVAVFVGLGVMGAMLDAEPETQTDNKQVEARQQPKDDDVVDEVEAALDALGEDMKSMLASTSQGGLQGEIESVEAYGKDGVKIYVTTHFQDAGDGEDGGQTIARKILGNICLDVPELNSVYVSSTTSGLDSRSVYRSDLAGCKL